MNLSLSARLFTHIVKKKLYNTHLKRFSQGRGGKTSECLLQTVKNVIRSDRRTFLSRAHGECIMMQVASILSHQLHVQNKWAFTNREVPQRPGPLRATTPQWGDFTRHSQIQCTAPVLMIRTMHRLFANHFRKYSWGKTSNRITVGARL